MHETQERWWNSEKEGEDGEIDGEKEGGGGKIDGEEENEGEKEAKQRDKGKRRKTKS